MFDSFRPQPTEHTEMIRIVPGLPRGFDLPITADELPNTPDRAYVTGMAIALGAILMFFIALASACVVRKGLPNSDWQSFEAPRILWLNTVILLASSFTLRRSKKNLLAFQEDSFRHWWGVTVILGLFFIAGQFIAWHRLAAEGIFLATNPSSSFFYVFTFAHALHVLGGIAALSIIAMRVGRHRARDTSVEAAALYWHFMGGLWLALFLLLQWSK